MTTLAYSIRSYYRWTSVFIYRSADKSLALSRRKQAEPVKSVMGRGMDWFG